MFLLQANVVTVCTGFKELCHIDHFPILCLSNCKVFAKPTGQSQTPVLETIDQSDSSVHALLLNADTFKVSVLCLVTFYLRWSWKCFLLTWDKWQRLCDFLNSFIPLFINSAFKYRWCFEYKSCLMLLKLSIQQTWFSALSPKPNRMSMLMSCMEHACVMFIAKNSLIHYIRLISWT